MDEMNPLENQLQSWKPRLPSPKIARRLFGPAAKPSLRPARHLGAWNWLSPAAACALTMLVVVHTASRVPGRLGQGSNGTLLASNAASFTFSEMDENLEYNFWPHFTPPVKSQRAETLSRREIWNLIPTNR
jgi:hypothetical protein